MRLILDIPNDKFNDEVVNSKCVLAITETTTNGDVIKVMFPNANVYIHNGGATYSVNNEYNFNATWWNSPYKAESEE